jgi:signal transduction histidine kinase
MALELMQDSVRGEGAELLTDAMQLAQTMEQMANGLLDVSRLEQGKMPVQRAPCDLSQLAARICHEARTRTPQRAITCNSVGPVRVDCDAALIARVLSNLISNGIKHAADSCQLQVGVAATARGARVFVQDDGPGVPAELQDRLFEKFAAVALRKEHRYHSAGLGLAFFKLAVQAHGGSIGVDSAPGRGSTFWFELPA